MKKQFILALGLLVGLFSCIDQQEFQQIVSERSGSVPTEPVLDNTAVDSIDIAILYTKDENAWKTSQFTIDGSGANGICRLDDIMTLSEDGTYQFDGGSLLCGFADNTRMKTGKWEVSEDNKSLVFDPLTADEFRAVVVDQTATRLELIGNYNFSGINLKLRGVYVK